MTFLLEVVEGQDFVVVFGDKLPFLYQIVLNHLSSIKTKV